MEQNMKELMEQDMEELIEQNMEQPGPPPQVSESLRIINDAIGFSGKYLMNKHQCESLTDRLHPIGEELKELSKEYIDVGRASGAAVQLNYPAFEVLLTVLRKAEALLLRYRESTTSIIPSVLTRGEDRQAFQEINAELDMLNSSFQFDSFEYVATESMLTANADEDLKEMWTSLDGLAESRPQVLELATNLEKVKLVITEKSEVASDGDLPSYLNIDPASVEIKDPVRMPVRLSTHDDEKTDGWALVRFGTYLGCEFALKVFSSGDATWNKSELLKEVRSLMRLHHPHVVQLMGFAQDEEKCIILMELMDTDLRHFMQQRSCDGGKRPFARSEEMDIITQIARGLLYLHEQEYVHGELKCSNILVKRIGDAIDVKISDLRSSQKLGVWDAASFKERSSRWRSRWTAPEVTRYGESLEPTHELLKKADVYSFGMVCFEVVTGKHPFQDIREEALKRRIATGELKQELPGELDENLRALIESCWDRDPNARPTVEEICHLLDFIRSSQPAGANVTSGKVMGLFRAVVPLIMRLGAIRREDPPATTRGHTEPGEGIYDEVTLLEFVKIDPKKLKKGELLGKGASADVHEATWLGCQFAMKTYRGRGASIAKEVKFLVELRHPCIVRLMGLAVHSEQRYSIVMEFMGCSVRKLIDLRKRKRKIAHTAPFDLRETLHIVKRVAVGMAFLHFRGVTHRDLKSDNILVPDHPDSIDVKITDFGVSQLIDPSEKPSLGVGTTFWRAPEMFPNSKMQSYDLKAADVYSFAVTCYEVVTGRRPFEDDIEEGRSHEQVRLAVVGGLRPTLPCDLHPELKVLIEECWDGKPEKRPTFFTICQTLQNIQHGLQNS